MTTFTIGCAAALLILSASHVDALGAFDDQSGKSKSGGAELLAQTQGMENRDERRDDRQDDRQDRGDDRQDCRQAEGVGSDKRDCKQDARQERNQDG